MHKPHLIVGATFLALFLATGGYMIAQFPDLYQGREEVRMMYRATHIYILMASLLNLAFALVYLSQRTPPSRTQTLASGFILVTPLLFLVGFWLEPPTYNLARPYSFTGVVFMLAGTVLYTLTQFKHLRGGDKS